MNSCCYISSLINSKITAGQMYINAPCKIFPKMESILLYKAYQTIYKIHSDRLTQQEKHL